MNPSPTDEATEKQADAPAEAVPVNPPAECPEGSGDSVGVQSKEEVPMHSESVPTPQVSEIKEAEVAEEPAPKEKDSADPVKTAENAEEKEVAKEESAKDGAKKRHNGRRNHKPSPMETDPTFVPRDARYFCHDVRGEAP